MSAVTIEDTEYDLFCQQRLQNPYPLYARLREVDPVHWCEPLKSWLVTRHKDVFHGLRDTRRLSTSREGMYAAPLLPQKRELARPLIEHINHWLLNNDPPDHTRMRKLINLAFTPRMLRRMLPRNGNGLSTNSWTRQVNRGIAISLKRSAYPYRQLSSATCWAFRYNCSRSIASASKGSCRFRRGVDRDSTKRSSQPT